MYYNSLILIYVLYKRELINSFETIGYSCCIMMSIVLIILDCLGQVYAGVVFGYCSPYKGYSARFSEVASDNPTSTCILWVDG